MKRTYLQVAAGFCLALAFLSWLPSSSAGPTPQTMHYQGRLTDTNGTPINGTVSKLTFRIFNQSSPLDATTFVWGEAHTNVVVRRGVFSVRLGAGQLTVDANGGETNAPNPLLPSDLNGGDRWIQAQVDANPPLSPPIALGAVPHAISAASAESLFDSTTSTSLDIAALDGRWIKSLENVTPTAAGNIQLLQGSSQKIQIIPGVNAIEIETSALNQAEADQLYVTPTSHATLDHSGVPGVGFSAREALLNPKASLLSGRWLPALSGSPALVSVKPPYGNPSATSGGTVGIGNAGPWAQFAPDQITFPTCRSAWLPRLIVKWELSRASAVGGAFTNLELVFGEYSPGFPPANNTTTFRLQFDQNTTILTPWSVERRVGGVLKPAVDMGLGSGTAGSALVGRVFYFVVDYTSPTTYTIQALDVDLNVLYSATHAGASEVPVFIDQGARIIWGGGAGVGPPGSRGSIKIYGVDLSFGGL